VITIDASISLEEAIHAIESNNKKRKATTSRYVDTSFIPPTSNVVERLFSQAKSIYTPHRPLSTTTLENILFLKTNSELWDASLFDEKK
jgi:hypothetical protein